MPVLRGSALLQKASAHPTISQQRASSHGDAGPGPGSSSRRPGAGWCGHDRMAQHASTGQAGAGPDPALLQLRQRWDTCGSRGSPQHVRDQQTSSQNSGGSRSTGIAVLYGVPGQTDSWSQRASRGVVGLAVCLASALLSFAAPQLATAHVSIDAYTGGWLLCACVHVQAGRQVCVCAAVRAYRVHGCLSPPPLHTHINTYLPHTWHA